MSVDADLAHTVYFEGSWNDEDQHCISEAVADFESSFKNIRLISDSPSWVCVAYDVGSSSLFCAHRPHLPRVLSASSVDGLAQSIRDAS